ncbi:hypothetical protein GYH30_022374 [Glycine max]|nr:hypothetical protein GYH30_022374 [Glycine max]
MAPTHLKTKYQTSIKRMFTIGGERHQVIIIEEGASDDGRHNFSSRRPSDSLEELYSDGIDGESLISPYSPPYELRRQPNNQHSDPKVVADSDGGPPTGTGILIRRATDPLEANHSDDPSSDPLNTAQV